MDTNEAEILFKSMYEEQIKKLTAVGFTREQAEALLEMMQTKAFTGGLGFF